VTAVDPEALGASLRRLKRRREPAVLEQSLRQLVSACVGLFGYSGCGVMLADEHGELHCAVAHDKTSRLLGEAQMTTGQGPCVDTFVRQMLIASDDLRDDPRWPEVTARLRDQEVRAVIGVPLRLSGVAVGSLDVFHDRRHRWDRSERHALSRYAEIGGAMLAAAVSAEQSGELAAQLTHALQHRAPIERGVGYLMARDGIGQGEAFDRLRAAARRNRRKIGEVAADLLHTGRLPGERRRPPATPGPIF
jgi:transcriptional regulator with GAF, ATPase, and Fis domain